MKFLKIASLLLITVLLTACHSTELTLRHSKVKKYTTPAEEGNQEALTLSPTPSSRPQTISPTNPVQSTKQSDISSSDIAEQKSIIQEEKLPSKQTQHQQRSFQTQKHVIHSTYQQSKALASRHKQKVNGLFGGIGHAFGVVGLVFLFVGIILFLIGGLIIDTLGALFIGFGFLFLLIWLVLIVLQVVFDVIL
ncbi:MAG: PspC domain-containing protein [Flavobacteriales bacterium]